MVVDVFRLGRVVLHHAIIVAPEQSLDLAHLVPCGGAVVATHAYVLPSHAVAGLYRDELTVFKWHSKHAVMLVTGMEVEDADTVFIWTFEGHLCTNPMRRIANSISIAASRRASWLELN